MNPSKIKRGNRKASSACEEVSVGKTYGRLTVREKTEKTNPKLGFLWKCECECGSTLLVPTYSLKSGNKKSCGCLRREKCSLLRKSSSLQVEQKCLNCKQTFWLRQRQVLRKKYCSWECRKAHMREENSSNYGGGEKIKGAANPNWKGGVDCDRDKALVSPWRTRVFKRDKYTCARCKLSKPPTNFLRVHHIAPWSKYPDLRFQVANGITLCADCHSFIHKTFALEEMDASGRYLEDHIDLCLHQSIFVAGWEQAFLWLLCWSEDLKFKLFVKKTLGVRTFFLNDFPQFLFFPTFTTTTYLDQDSSIAFLLQHLASLSQYKVKGSAQTMNETVSQTYSDKSNKLNQSGLSQKTSGDSSVVPGDQAMDREVTSVTCSCNFTTAGMMRNGSVSVADTLPPPSLENDYCWLESPGAFSTSGKNRPPGLNRLETFLKRKGLLSKGEVLSPVILSEWYSLPPTYLDPSESRTAAQLLEDSERQLEIFSIPVLGRSHSDESFTSTACSPEKFLEEKHDLPPSYSSTKSRAESEPEFSSKKKPSGCLYRYLEHKKLKSGMIASYPRVEGDRDPDKIDHWRWAYNWEEKIHDEWKNRSIAVPKHLVSVIKTMINANTPALEIREFIKSWKLKSSRT